jgi:hypothetical protein
VLDEYNVIFDDHQKRTLMSHTLHKESYVLGRTSFGLLPLRVTGKEANLLASQNVSIYHLYCTMERDFAVIVSWM